MTPARVVPVITGPTVARRVHNGGGIEALRHKQPREGEGQRDQRKSDDTKCFLQMLHVSQSGSLLTQRLQVSHQVVNVVVGVFPQ